MRFVLVNTTEYYDHYSSVAEKIELGQNICVILAFSMGCYEIEPF